MRTPLGPQRARCDSVLDTRLTPEQQDDLYDRIDKGMPYRTAEAWLLEQHGITLSDTAIWTWVQRRKRLSRDLTFSRLLETIKADRDQAVALGREVGSANDLNAANVLLLSQALFETRRADDLRGTAEVAKLFTSVLSAVTASRRAEQSAALGRQRNRISAFAARTARDRFRYDAAQAALQHAAELQRLNADHDLDQRARIDRAVERLFGPALADPPALPVPAPG